jgi:plastocyanin
MSRRAMRPRMTGEIRFRVPLVLLPILVLLAIGLLTFGFSRVLLALEAEVATVVALVTAANLLGACAFIALRPETARRRWAELAAVVIYPVLIGIAVAQTGYGQVAEESAAATEKPGAPNPGGGLVAENISFNPTELTATAGDKTTFTFDNEDQATHNFTLFETEADAQSQDSAIYTSPDAPAGASVDVEFTAPGKPGDYPFLCEYHPTTMKGTLVVEGGTGGTGEGSGSTGGGDGSNKGDGGKSGGKYSGG